MKNIKLFLIAAAMVASPAMAGGNSTVSYGNGWWDGWMAADVMYRVNGTASATGKFIGDVGKGAVETAANVGEGAVDVVGEVAGTVIVDIPVGLVGRLDKVLAWSTGASDPRYRTGTWTWGWL